ncbi:hypothetical protein SAMN05518849_110113 [Sphingobium sp. AP50]|nr:hypothetical protein [Sphingobium sp. AP50]SEJ65142.1 hypothetical protein SAMN05518849_110113 [Sphingobium sp. AP50]
MNDQARETALRDAALAALRRGDIRVALAALEEMTDAPAMLLAQAHNRNGDLDGEAAALRRMLIGWRHAQPPRIARHGAECAASRG